jgi:uncharacterized metal-binding protein YceD (DUF177 family)
VDPLREYNIPFVGLKPGEHLFSYRIDRAFFEQFPDSLVRECDINVKLKLNKDTGFLLLDFEISGTLEQPCNRCQRPLNFPVDADYNVVVKFGDEPVRDEQEPDEDVIYMDRNETHLNVAQLIYEFITLAIPVHRVVCENVGLECDPAVLKVLHDLNEQKENNPDPRWADLKNIKFKK